MKLHIFFKFLFFSTLIIFNTFSRECKVSPEQEIRLDQPGYPMHNFPVRDQGSIGNCFAQVGAMLNDVKRSIKNKSELEKNGYTSPLGLSFLSNKGRTTGNIIDKITGGYICQSVDTAAKSQVCPVKSVEDKIIKEGKSSVIDQFDDYKKNNEEILKVKSFADEINLIDHTSPCPGIDHPVINPLTQFSNRLSDILVAILKKNPYSTKFEKMATQCENPVPKDPNPSKCENVSGMKGFTMARDIIRKFCDIDKKDPPVAISYCSNVLTKGKEYVGLNNKEQKFDCDMHASIIIGYRVNEKTGKEEVLIQNSWGTSCNGYSKDWECQNGKIWVEKDALGNNLAGYNTI